MSIEVFYRYFNDKNVKIVMLFDVKNLENILLLMMGINDIKSHFNNIILRS